MIETTGENRDFKRSDLDQKKQRLMQAIAASLEESLCAGGQRTGTECDHHRKGAVALFVGIRCGAISSDMKLSSQAARSIG
jgi:hypothetical protein